MAVAAIGSDTRRGFGPYSCGAVRSYGVQAYGSQGVYDGCPSSLA